MLTHGEQIEHGEKLVTAAGRWAEARGFGSEKTLYAKTFAAAVSAVQPGGPAVLTFDEMEELIDELVKFLAQRMAEEFHDIPIAMTVLNGKVYGAYIGNWEPYELPAYEPRVANIAIGLGLFKTEALGEIDGEPVKWWRNKRET
jgi:hypothetical protein